MTDLYLVLVIVLGLLVFLAVAVVAHHRAAAQRDRAIRQRDTARDRARSAWAAAGEARAMLAAAKAELHEARANWAATNRALGIRITHETIAWECLTRITSETATIPLDDVTVEMQAVIAAEVDQVLNDLRKDS